MGSFDLLGFRGALRVLFTFALIASPAALSGCGGDDVPPAAPAVRGEDLSTCDIATDPCQRGIYNSVAQMLEADGFPIPTIRTISVDQHAAEVRAGLDLNDLTGEDATSRGLRLLGFIPEASDSLTEAQAEYFITQVAAYYSRGGRAITVVDRDYEPGSAQVILAHEFIHAIQDSQFNLNTVGSNADSEDGVIGVRSVIEGDAVFSSFDWYYDVISAELTAEDWQQINDDGTSRLRERVADTENALIDTASSFPYSFGFEYMTVLSLADGLPARAAAFESPPTTAAEVLAGYGAPPPPFDVPASAHPSPLDGGQADVRNRYGAWYVYGFLLRQGMADEDAWATALGWVGDELAIYDDGEEVVVVWRVRFSDETGAGTLADLVNAEEAEGARSAAVLGEDAFVFAAETTETLLAWLDQPLDEMTASIVPKAAKLGGAVSSGGCTLINDPALVDPHAILHRH